jgi:hypothetical protein
MSKNFSKEISIKEANLLRVKITYGILTEVVYTINKQQKNSQEKQSYAYY